MHPPPTEIPDNILASTLNQRTRFAVAYSILEDAIAERAFPGAAFGVSCNDEVVALDGVGHFTYDRQSPLVRPMTVFDLASVTKVAATTASAMVLYDRGLLHLDQLLGEILPNFVSGASPGKGQVMLRHLLAHSSGLPAYARLFETHRTPEALLAACMQMPLEAAPGTRAEYSDIGFILLGKVIEVLTGESLARFCALEIFAPLGLTATRYQPPPSWREFIPPTVEDTAFRRRIIQGEVHDENASILGGVSGHAGLFSNVLDLLRIAACILNGGTTLDGHQLFQPSTIQTFSQRQSPPGGSRALGWDTPSEASSSGRHFNVRSIGHLGYTGASLWIDLEYRLSIVLLTNRTWPDRATQAIRAVRPAFHDAIFDGLTLAQLSCNPV